MSAWDPAVPFDWRDGDRVVHYGRGRVAEAVDRFGGPGFVLLTTPRASRRELVEAASAVLHVPPGLVDEVAGDLLDEVPETNRLVALGGGRVIDVAKAIAAARSPHHERTAIPDERNGSVPDLAARDRKRTEPVLAGAIPTTLSGAEMTRGHRHARGIDPRTARLRPRFVLNDPALSASQAVPDLAASALNALGHAVEGPVTPNGNPVAAMAAVEGARLLVGAFDGGGEPDRDAAALGALLAGYAIDSGGYGLHHVMAQTVVRIGGIGHAAANSILLPHTIGALAGRFPARHAILGAALGEEPADAAARLCALTGATTLLEAGLDPQVLEACADAASRRAELDDTPPRADRAELLGIYRAAL